MIGEEVLRRISGLAQTYFPGLLLLALDTGPICGWSEPTLSWFLPKHF